MGVNEWFKTLPIEIDITYRVKSVALRIRSELNQFHAIPTVPSLKAQSRWAISRRPPDLATVELHKTNGV